MAKRLLALRGGGPSGGEAEHRTETNKNFTDEEDSHKQVWQPMTGVSTKQNRLSGLGGRKVRKVQHELGVASIDGEDRNVITKKNGKGFFLQTNEKGGK